jgi:hypothetical protein
MSYKIPDGIQNKYDFHNYNNALEILAYAYPDEWKDILEALDRFVILTDDLSASGGSETNIPGKIDSVLFARKWKDVLINASLEIKIFDRVVDMKQYEKFPSRESMIPEFMAGHVDYLKGRVAVYLEWNKKDLAFDKTLTDIRQLYECGIISVAVVITRGEDLNDAFKMITDTDGKSVFRKYGSSSTWMGRLLPRLNSREAGGCPVLAIGIKKACIEGY